MAPRGAHGDPDNAHRDPDSAHRDPDSGTPKITQHDPKMTQHCVSPTREITQHDRKHYTANGCPSARFQLSVYVFGRFRNGTEIRQRENKKMRKGQLPPFRVQTVGVWALEVCFDAILVFQIIGKSVFEANY